MAHPPEPPPDSDAPPPAVFAVTDFHGFMMGGNTGALVSFGKAATATLSAELALRPGMRVVERARVRRALDELGIPATRRLDDPTAVEIGRRAGAGWVLHGQTHSILEDLEMEIRVVDVEAGEAVTGVKARVPTVALAQVAAELAEALAESLGLPTVAEGCEVGPVPVTATIELSRALDFEDRGLVERAAAHYRAVLEIDPRHAAARLGLLRLEDG